MGVAGCYRYGWPDHPGIRTQRCAGYHTGNKYVALRLDTVRFSKTPCTDANEVGPGVGAREHLRTAGWAELAGDICTPIRKVDIA